MTRPPCPSSKCSSPPRSTPRLAAQNALIALELLGYGGVYIGGIRNKPEEVAKELDLPPGVFAVFGMAVGRPDPAKAGGVRPRLGQGAVLHREQYALERGAARGGRRPMTRSSAISRRRRAFPSRAGFARRSRACAAPRASAAATG